MVTTDSGSEKPIENTESNPKHKGGRPKGSTKKRKESTNQPLQLQV